MPRTQNTQTAASSSIEKGKRPPAGKTPPEDEPDGRESSHGHDRERELDAGWEAGEADRCQHQHEQRKRKRAGREAEDGQRGEPQAGARLERPQREQRKGRAEREGIRAGEDDPRPDHGERPARPACGGTPLARDDHGEGQRGRGDAEHRQQLDPQEGRGGVVEEAVRDEAVAALVPEVVPDLEAVVAEEPALVDVCGQVAPWRAEDNEQRRDQRRESEGKQGLCRKRREKSSGRRLHGPIFTRRIRRHRHDRSARDFRQLLLDNGGCRH